MLYITYSSVYLNKHYIFCTYSYIIYSIHKETCWPCISPTTIWLVLSTGEYKCVLWVDNTWHNCWPATRPMQTNEYSQTQWAKSETRKANASWGERPDAPPFIAATSSPITRSIKLFPTYTDMSSSTTAYAAIFPLVCFIPQYYMYWNVWVYASANS